MSETPQNEESSIYPVHNLTTSRVVVCFAYLISFGFACLAQHFLTVSTNLEPILITGISDCIATLIIFIVSFIVNNSSVYDPYWSIAPVPIVVIACVFFCQKNPFFSVANLRNGFYFYQKKKQYFK